MPYEPEFVVTDPDPYVAIPWHTRRVLQRHAAQLAEQADRIAWLEQRVRELEDHRHGMH